eukprot:340179-Rhodomonas_salina.1
MPCGGNRRDADGVGASRETDQAAVRTGEGRGYPSRTAPGIVAHGSETGTSSKKSEALGQPHRAPGSKAHQPVCPVKLERGQSARGTEYGQLGLR